MPCAFATANSSSRRERFEVRGADVTVGEFGEREPCGCDLCEHVVPDLGRGIVERGAVAGDLGETVQTGGDRPGVRRPGGGVPILVDPVLRSAHGMLPSHVEGSAVNLFPIGKILAPRQSATPAASARVRSVLARPEPDGVDVVPHRRDRFDVGPTARASTTARCSCTARSVSSPPPSTICRIRCTRVVMISDISSRNGFRVASKISWWNCQSLRKKRAISSSDACSRTDRRDLVGHRSLLVERRRRAAPAGRRRLRVRRVRRRRSPR